MPSGVHIISDVQSADSVVVQTLQLPAHVLNASAISINRHVNYGKGRLFCMTSVFKEEPCPVPVCVPDYTVYREMHG